MYVPRGGAPAGGQAHRDAGRAVVVVEEVGPEQGAAGEAAGAAGARELLAERPSGRCRKLRARAAAPRPAPLRASHRPPPAPTAAQATAGVTACNTASAMPRPTRMGRSAMSTNDMTSTYGLSARGM